MNEPVLAHETESRLVEILDVAVSENRGALAGCFLEQPSVGGAASRTNTYALDVLGWVVGRRSAVAAVELVHAGESLWRLPLHALAHVASRHPDSPGADSAGFYGTVNTLRLPTRFTVIARAVLEDGTREDFATIRAQRASLRSAFQPTLQPLILTTLGRTGSTMVVRALGAHPDIVAYPPFGYEPRVASYWTDVLQALSEPASYRRQFVPGTGSGADRNWWLGATAPAPRAVRDPAVAEWMGVANIEALASFCQERIETAYETIATEAGVERPRYFAEKYWASSTNSAFMWELYPNAREVFVARDFRDMLCSMHAFDAKRGFQGFGRQRVQTDEDHVRELEGRVAKLLQGWEERSDRAHLLRYEDLVSQPSGTLTALLSYLDLESSSKTVDSMIVAMEEATPEMEAHRTTVDANASVGRWRRELKPELQVLCESAFGPALEGFGYALEHGSAAR